VKEGRKNIKLSTLEGKLTYKRMRWCGHILRINGEFKRLSKLKQKENTQDKTKIKMGTVD
jgi:hypothetical protein